MIILAKFVSVTLSLAILFFGLHAALSLSFLFKRFKELQQQGVSTKNLRTSLFPAYTYVLLAMPFAGVVILYFG